MAGQPDLRLRVIVTAVGKNRPGVLAEITTAIARHDGNIMDISQKMMRDYFNLIMIVELLHGGRRRAKVPTLGPSPAVGSPASQKRFATFKQHLEELGRKQGYQVNVQHETIFRYMHRV